MELSITLQQYKDALDIIEKYRTQNPVAPPTEPDEKPLLDLLIDSGASARLLNVMYQVLQGDYDKGATYFLKNYTFKDIRRVRSVGLKTIEELVDILKKEDYQLQRHWDIRLWNQ